ncbi:MAG: hypothetical protein WBG50_26260, partial [Desulfomonilaceae bacterium]
MDHPGHQGLAGPGFSDQQDRGAAWRHFFEELLHFQYGRALADYQGGSGIIRKFQMQGGSFSSQILRPPSW